MANGQVERKNNTLITRIRMYIAENHLDWDEHLPYAVYSTNIHVNETTQHSPFELVYGRSPKLPADSTLTFQKSVYQDIDDYAANIKQHFAESLTHIQNKLQQNQSKYKETYDKKTHNIEYKIGDLVLKENQSIKKGLAQKFQPLFNGPYTIRKIKYPNITIEKTTHPFTIETLHVNRTKPYNASDTASKLNPKSTRTMPGAEQARYNLRSYKQFLQPSQ